MLLDINHSNRCKLQPKQSWNTATTPKVPFCFVNCYQSAGQTSWVFASSCSGTFSKAQAVCTREILSQIFYPHLNCTRKKMEAELLLCHNQFLSSTYVVSFQSSILGWNWNSTRRTASTFLFAIWPGVVTLYTVEKCSLVNTIGLHLRSSQPR